MNRQANLLYLQNLRDLEVARVNLQKYHADYLEQNDYAVRRTKENTVFQKEAYFESEVSLSTWQPPQKPLFIPTAGRGFLFFSSTFLLLFFFFIFIALLFEGLDTLSKGDSVLVELSITFSIIFCIDPIIEIFSFVKRQINYNQEVSRTRNEVNIQNKRIREENIAIKQSNDEKAKNNIIVRRNNQLLKEQMDAEISRLLTLRQKHNTWYEAELGKLNTLISDFYNMNVLPNSTYHTWRGLAPVCYIYDVLSTTSELTLKDVLFSQQFEAGIQRLEAKMDTMIGQLGALVYETRCIKQNTDILIQQNEEMLTESSRNMNTLIEQNKKQVHSVQELEESMKRNEQYSLEAAQYASLSANYAKANAYFSLAEYLKN